MKVTIDRPIVEQDSELDYDKREPFIKKHLAVEALLTAFREQWRVENLGSIWTPRSIGDGHTAIFEYLTPEDWKSFNERDTNGHFKSEYEDLNHCLLALALAATISGVDVSEVIK